MSVLFPADAVGEESWQNQKRCVWRSMEIDLNKMMALRRVIEEIVESKDDFNHPEIIEAAKVILKISSEINWLQNRKEDFKGILGRASILIVVLWKSRHPHLPWPPAVLETILDLTEIILHIDKLIERKFMNYAKRIFGGYFIRDYGKFQKYEWRLDSVALDVEVKYNININKILLDALGGRAQHHDGAELLAEDSNTQRKANIAAESTDRKMESEVDQTKSNALEKIKDNDNNDSEAEYFKMSSGARARKRLSQISEDELNTGNEDVPVSVATLGPTREKKPAMTPEQNVSQQMAPAQLSVSTSNISINNYGSETVARSDVGKIKDSEQSWTTTCWIAAEHALQHARNNISSVSEVFGRWQIQKPEYVVHAGFDESLIKSGVGFLEQIHVFVFAEVDATSSLLSELGRLFSPFSSSLFTGSSSYRLPVFKDDGSVWEFDELVYFTASKFADGGSSAKSPLTIISLSETPSLGDGMTGFSHSSSGSGEGEKNKKQRLGKGKERDTGDKDKDKGNKGDKDPSDDAEDQPGDQGGIITGAAIISFEIASEIHPIQDNQNAFQTLTMHGSLTVETTLAQNPPKFSERFVQFTTLTFDTEPTSDFAYKQFHLRVVVDSQQENAKIEVIKPKRTSNSDGEEKQSTSTKSSRTRGMTASLTLGLPHPQGAITGATMKTNEETTGSEKKQYKSAITEHRGDGNVRWGFNIDDDNLQKWGIDIQEGFLPAVRFKFVGDSNVPAPPPKCMDIVITSYWSMILPSEPKSTWIRKLLLFFRSTGNTQTISYSNLFQITALKADLSTLQEPSHYRAKVKVKSGASGPPDVKRRAEDSVNVTPAVVDDLRKLSNFNLAAKFRLSDNYIPVMENLGHNIKSH